MCSGTIAADGALPARDQAARRAAETARGGDPPRPAPRAHRLPALPCALATADPVPATAPAHLNRTPFTFE